MEMCILLIILGSLLIALCVGDIIIERIIIAHKKKYVEEIDEDWNHEYKKNPSLQ